VGPVGFASTSLHVNGTSKFVGLVTTGDVFVSGALTALGTYNINNISSGAIRASSIGIGTTNPLTALQIGTASTLGVPTNGFVFAVTGIGSVGIGTTVPRAHLDVEGLTRLKSYVTTVGTATIASNAVTLDCSVAQTFNLTVSSNVNEFLLSNIPNNSSVITLKITQNSTGGFGVGIDTFKTTTGTAIPVYWPGGVTPGVTTTASKTDIYSFMIFDGATITSSGLYGVIGGQNFS